LQDRDTKEASDGGLRRAAHSCTFYNRRIDDEADNSDVYNCLANQLDSAPETYLQFMEVGAACCECVLRAVSICCVLRAAVSHYSSVSL